MMIKMDEAANRILAKLKQDITNEGLKPKLLIILASNDEASVKYVNIKQKRCSEVGMICNVKIAHMYEDFEVFMRGDYDGIIVQLPIKEEFKEYTNDIIRLIPSDKDVDCLNDSRFESPMVLAMQEAIKLLNIEVDTVSIWGSGKTAGEPIYKYLCGIADKKNIYIINENTDKKIAIENTKKSNLVIGATGVKDIIKKEYLKENANLIPVNYSDFEESCFEDHKSISPIGGIGPVVVAGLLDNVYRSALAKKSNDNKNK